MSSETYGRLILQQGPSVGGTYQLSSQSSVIGRDTGADIVIAMTAVSRRHARISRQGNLYYVEDLGSSNGTFVNGQPAIPSQPLRHGDEIGLGKSILFRFEAPGAGPTALNQPEATQIDEAMTALDVPTPPDEPPAVAAQLMVTTSGTSTQTCDLSGSQITLGRAEDNDIVVRSPIVSRYHARIVRSDAGYQIETLQQASNPLYFNNQPISRPHLLRNGDQLQIGRSESEHRVALTFHAPQEVSARAAQAPAPAIPEGGQTMLAEDFVMPVTTVPPQLQVAIAGNPPRTHTLDKDRLTIGRAPDNDIVIDSQIVSRHHARIERVRDGYQMVPFPEAGNPIFYEGRALDFSRRLKHQDMLRIGGLDPGLMVTMIYQSPSEPAATDEAQTVELGEKTVIMIGRDPSNDVVLDLPIVSRYHAQIERIGQRYRVKDLRSSNGTFVNDERIEGEVWLNANDTIRIGPSRFVMGQDQLAQYDESRGLRVEAVGLNKWVRKDLNILQNISLLFKPREFVVVVGQSGGGKSTLVDAIAGYRPATHGSVHVNDVDVYKNFDVIRNDIGYVPQRDIIHMELTVFQALDYAAQLRMPPDTSREERHKRIEAVLEDLDLAHRKDVQISGLSGGQQKRVSIGVELLTKPGLFFLDEPTSGLDPGTETSLMQLMRRLADQGRTIVLITHATKNVMLADKVAFLARGGFLAWFGPPDEALMYFDQYRSERDRRARDIEFDEIYNILGDPGKGNPREWAERFAQHAAFQQYIVQPLQEKVGALAAARDGQAAVAAAPKPTRRRQVSSLRQFLILSARNFKILTRDRFSLGLMLAAAPLVSLLDVILSLVLGRDPFSFEDGFMANVLITLFLLTVYGVMVGGLAQMREIVKEQEVYKRERLVNLRIFPYVLSKVWVAAVLAMYQSAVYVVVHYLVFDMPGSWLEFGIIYISLALATMAGMMLGLFASAVAPNPNSAPLIVILLMLPQIVLGGALVPLPEIISAPTSTRWAFQAFMAVTGSGSDVAADACWQLPEEQRNQLTLAEKDANCRCLGTKALREASCNFPGLGEFYRPAIDEPPPVEPVNNVPPEPVEPTRPELPPEPAEPTEQTQVAQAEYLAALQEWRSEVDEIQASYEAQLDDYRRNLEVFRASAEAYQTAVIRYQTDLGLWEGERLAAVGPAEQIIGQTVRDFGWLFVNKEDTDAYYGTIATTWIAQLAVIGILLMVILILQKRKDVV